MKRWLILGWVAAPLAVGLLLADVFWQGWWPNPILYARLDLGTLLWLVGMLISLTLALELWRRYRVEQHNAQIISQTRARAEDERHSFLRRLDHEIKNPLMAMRAGFANLSGTALDESQRSILESIEAQTLRLSRLLADLRKLAELGTQPLDFAPVALSELLQEAVSLAEERPEFTQRHVTLTLPQAPWPLSAISGDRDLLFLAIHNLLDNALKFTTSGDTIELRAYEDGNSVVVEVADTGPGIPEAEAPLVWDELYRGEAARGIPGSGLGLALAQAIAQRHGGSLALRSRLGQGSVFTLRLPRSEA